MNINDIEKKLAEKHAGRVFAPSDAGLADMGARLDALNGASPVVSYLRIALSILFISFVGLSLSGSDQHWPKGAGHSHGAELAYLPRVDGEIKTTTEVPAPIPSIPNKSSSKNQESTSPISSQTNAANEPAPMIQESETKTIDAAKDQMQFANHGLPKMGSSKINKSYDNGPKSNLAAMSINATAESKAPVIAEEAPSKRGAKPSAVSKTPQPDTPRLSIESDESTGKSTAETINAVELPAIESNPKEANNQAVDKATAEDLEIEDSSTNAAEVENAAASVVLPIQPNVTAPSTVDSVIQEETNDQKEDYAEPAIEETFKEEADKGKWSFEITCGLVQLNRQFSSSLVNATKREAEESDIISYRADVLVLRKFGKRFEVGTGLNLSRHGENVQYSSIATQGNREETTETYAQREEWFVDSFYDPSTSNYKPFYNNRTVTDTTRTITNIPTTDTNDAVTASNGITSFTYLAIPVRLGFVLLEKEKVSIDINASGAFGFLVASKGSYLDETGMRVSAAKSAATVINGDVSLGVNISLTQKAMFRIEPRYGLNLSNLSISEGISRKYGWYGLSLGFRYKL